MLWLKNKNMSNRILRWTFKSFNYEETNKCSWLGCMCYEAAGQLHFNIANNLWIKRKKSFIFRILESRLNLCYATIIGFVSSCSIYSISKMDCECDIWMYFVRMRWFFLALDSVDILWLVYSNFYANERVSWMFASWEKEIKELSVMGINFIICLKVCRSSQTLQYYSLSSPELLKKKTFTQTSY